MDKKFRYQYIDGWFVTDQGKITRNVFLIEPHLQ